MRRKIKTMTKEKLEDYMEKTQIEVDNLILESFEDGLSNDEMEKLAKRLQNKSNLIRARINVILSQIDLENQKNVLNILSKNNK